MASPTNHDPRVVSHFYLEYIESAGGMYVIEDLILRIHQ